MRNAILLILLSVSSIWASHTQAQLPESKLSVRSGTIASIFDQISKQSKLEFFYNTNILDVSKTVDIHIREGSLDEILRAVLGDGYTYTIKDHYVLISGKKTNIQQRQATVRGTVKDQQGSPLVGAAIIIKGTNTGTSTDATGAYVLNLPRTQDVTLVVRYLGMKDKEVKYNGETSLNIIMEEKSSEIREVVVTGYQTIDKERMTGAVDVISAAEIANKGYTSVDDILKGQIPGLVSMSLSGRPGASSTIRIRGINALNGDINPIWIIDGMPLQGDVPSVSMGGTEFSETVLTNGIGNIPPDDIESITILKDAAATAIYGSRAANGVIVVTTKRGTAGETYLNVQSMVGLTEAPTNKLKMMNTAEKMAFERGIWEDFPGLDVGGVCTRYTRRWTTGP